MSGLLPTLIVFSAAFLLLLAGFQGGKNDEL